MAANTRSKITAALVPATAAGIITGIILAFAVALYSMVPRMTVKVADAGILAIVRCASVLEDKASVTCLDTRGNTVLFAIRKKDRTITIARK